MLFLHVSAHLTQMEVLPCMSLAVSIAFVCLKKLYYQELLA